MNENELDQGQPEEPIQPTAPPRAEDALDYNEIVRRIVPVVEQVVVNNLKGLPAIIAQAVDAKSEDISNQIVDKLNARADAAAQRMDSQALVQQPPPQYQGNNGGPGGIDPNNPIVAMILKQIIGGNAPVETGGLDQMAKMATGWGNVMKSVMQPIAEMQAMMRQSVLAEMNTYSKTGGSLPWEGKESAPPAQASPQRANFNQPPDYSEAARAIASRIKV